MRPLLLASVALLAPGCMRVADVPPSKPERGLPPAKVDECDRQFDDQDAGFQTCLPGRGEGSAAE